MGMSRLIEANFPTCQSIYQKAFYQCSRLSYFTASKVKSIQDYAFYGCQQLIELSFPALLSVGTRAFSGCTSLASFWAPGTWSVGSYAFYNCRTLSAVNIEGAGYIGKYAFYNCSSLSQVILHEALEISDYAFYGTALEFNDGDLTFEYLDNIGNCAFQDVACLSGELYLPACATIGSSAFNGCTRLTQVNLPATLEIGEDAFKTCTSVSSVVMNVVEEIGHSAFAMCTSLENLTIKSPSVCTALSGFLDYTPFYSGTATGYIYVPENLLEDYQIAGEWISYAHYLSAISIDNTSFTLAIIDSNSETGDVLYTETFQKDENMTWAEWCDSEYNTGIIGYSSEEEEGYGVWYNGNIIYIG